MQAMVKAAEKAKPAVMKLHQHMKIEFAWLEVCFEERLRCAVHADVRAAFPQGCDPKTPILKQMQICLGKLTGILASDRVTAAEIGVQTEVKEIVNFVKNMIPGKPPANILSDGHGDFWKECVKLSEFWLMHNHTVKEGVPGNQKLVTKVIYGVEAMNVMWPAFKAKMAKDTVRDLRSIETFKRFAWLLPLEDRRLCDTFVQDGMAQDRLAVLKPIADKKKSSGSDEDLGHEQNH